MEELPEERIDIITPELIAKITDAKEVLKPKPQRSYYSFGEERGSDDFLQFF